MSQPPALPTMTPAAASPEKRSAIPKVFGIINICWGGLGIIGLAMTILSTVIQRNDPAAQKFQEMMAESQLWAIYQPVSMVTGVLCSVVLIVSGIGLIQRREWGRKLALLYCVIQFLLVPITFLITLKVMLPLVDRCEPGPERIGIIIGIVAGIFGIMVGLAYPLIMAIFLTRKKVKAACS